MKINFDTEDIFSLNVETENGKEMPEKIHELSLALSTIIIRWLLDQQMPVVVHEKFAAVILELTTEYLSDWHRMNTEKEV